jgi:hypothetical protein
VSWAGVFWVLLSELFSMSAKSPAASAATATLFLTGAPPGGSCEEHLELGHVYSKPHWQPVQIEHPFQLGLASH